jgi:hypothetical protein
VTPTEFYDDSGFPILDAENDEDTQARDSPTGSADAGEGEDQEEADEDANNDEEAPEPEVLDPFPKRRKKAALAKAKAAAKANPTRRVTGKQADPDTPQKHAGAAPASPKSTCKASSRPPQDVPLVKPRVAGPTKEKVSRCQLTALQTEPNGTLRRVHVYTSFLNSWGESFHVDMLKVSHAITQDGLTKKQALDLRDELKPK